MPRLSPSGLLKRLAQGQADVLDGVVPVDVEVAAGPHREVEPAVLGEEREHVVEEADAGATSAPPGPSRSSEHGRCRSRWWCGDLCGARGAVLLRCPAR